MILTYGLDPFSGISIRARLVNRTGQGLVGGAQCQFILATTMPSSRITAMASPWQCRWRAIARACWVWPMFLSPRARHR